VTCQKADWRAHKKTCNVVDATLPPPPPPPHPQAAATDALISSTTMDPPLPPAFPVKPTKMLSSDQRSEVYSANPEIRDLRSQVDDLIEATNSASNLFQTSQVTLAEKKLRACSQTAGALLKSMEKHRPSKYTEPTDLQQVVMVMFVDAATCLSTVLLNMATLKEMLSSPREALLLYQACLPQCESIGDTENAFACRVGVANCHRALGQCERAIDILKNELQMARVNKDAFGEAIVCNSLSKSFLAIPFSKEDDTNTRYALEYAKLDLEISTSFGDDGQLASAHAQIASCCNAAGDYSGAQASYETALGLLEGSDDLPTILLFTLEYGWMVMCEAVAGKNGETWQELGHALGLKALSVADQCRDKENAMLATAMCVRSGLGDGGSRSKLRQLCDEVGIGGETRETTCGVCAKPLDFEASEDTTSVFTMVRSCGHSYHQKCFQYWVGQDKLSCPSKKCEKPLLSWVKNDPAAVLRVAKGEENALNFF
jgi:tetratricopeptide (TPR) repeat protein